MLEILLVIKLWKTLGEKMREKGYEKPIGFQIFVVLAWFGGEFVSAVLYAVFRALQGNRNEGFDFGLYLVALLGAAAAAGLVFLIATKLLPTRETHAF